MIKKWRIGRWRITFTFAPVTNVLGVNSNLPDGNHVLMWDFDDTDLNTVVETLIRVQRIYDLPNIYVLSTKGGENFIAYCFKRTPWRKAVEILAFTKNVDWNFIKYSVYRGHFTLRVGAKCGRIPQLAWIIMSNVEEDCSIREMRSWVRYETLADEWRRAVKGAALRYKRGVEIR